MTLCLQDEIFSMASIKNVIEMCRVVCTFFNQSNNIVHEFEEIQKVHWHSSLSLSMTKTTSLRIVTIKITDASKCMLIASSDENN